MNPSRRIKTPLALGASALATLLLTLSMPVQAAGPTEELEVTMDVVDDPSDKAAGKELVVNEELEANDGKHEDVDDKAVGDGAHHDMDDADVNDGAHNDVDDADANDGQHEDVDDKDVNDGAHGDTDDGKPAKDGPA
jgi:hypothetical protein